MDLGTENRAQHVFLPHRIGCVRLVCAPTGRRALLGGHVRLCSRSDEQAAGDHLSLCSSSARLLAAWSSLVSGGSSGRCGGCSGRQCFFQEINLGESALVSDVGDRRDRHHEGRKVIQLCGGDARTGIEASAVDTHW